MSDHSDALSRGSSCHSASPLPHQNQLIIVGGPATFGRPLLKRKSVEELGSPLEPPNLSSVVKRLASPDPSTRRCSSALETTRGTGGALTPTFGHSTVKKTSAISGNQYLSLPSVPAQLNITPSPSGAFQPLGWLNPHQQLLFGGANGFGKNAVAPFLSAMYASGLNMPRAPEAPAPLPSQFTLNCAICRKECPNALALQEHILSHVCDRPYICQHCDAGFTTSQQLEVHLLSHQEKVIILEYNCGNACYR